METTKRKLIFAELKKVQVEGKTFKRDCSISFLLVTVPRDFSNLDK